MNGIQKVRLSKTFPHNNHINDPFLVRSLREELQLLMEPGSYVGEVIKLMGKTKVLVKVKLI